MLYGSSLSSRLARYGGLALFGLCFYLPLPALAASHTYTCADFETVGPGWSCASDIFTAAPGGTYLIDDNYSADWGTASPLYFTFTYTGAGQLEMKCREGMVDKCANTQFFTSSQSETSWAHNDVSTHFGLELKADAGTTFAGAISSLCVDDDGSSCTSSPGTIDPTSGTRSTVITSVTLQDASNAALFFDPNGHLVGWITSVGDLAGTETFGNDSGDIFGTAGHGHYVYDTDSWQAAPWSSLTNGVYTIVELLPDNIPGGSYPNPHLAGTNGLRTLSEALATSTYVSTFSTTFTLSGESAGGGGSSSSGATSSALLAFITTYREPLTWILGSFLFLAVLKFIAALVTSFRTLYRHYRPF